MTLPLKTLTNLWDKATCPSATGSLSWLTLLQLLVGHVAFLAVIYSILYAVGIVTYAPTGDLLISWDANWFSSVRNHGYDTYLEGQSNIPFFPLFPYLWRVLRFGGLGISLFNGALFLLGMAWLGRAFSLRRRQILLLLSVPAVFICYVPYAEALFFLFGAVLLCGLHRSHLGLTLLGLLGCCLTRSAATLFVPAFVLACTSRADIPRLALRLSTGLLAIAATLGGVFFMHYKATGNPLIFFEAHKQWGHVPHWPLATHGHSSAGLIMLWLDMLSLFIGSLAAVVCAVLGIRWLMGLRKDVPPAAPSRAVVFSLGYAVAAIAFILLYQAGDLVGSTRYVLATPFFGVLLAQAPRWQQLGRRAQWYWIGVAVVLCLAIAVWLGWPTHFPGFFPAETQWFFAVWIAYLVLYLLAAPGIWRYGREVQAGLYVANVIYQAFLFNLFLGAIWLG
jgi:hypothetical protein